MTPERLAEIRTALRQYPDSVAFELLAAYDALVDGSAVRQARQREADAVKRAGDAEAHAAEVCMAAAARLAESERERVRLGLEVMRVDREWTEAQRQIAEMRNAIDEWVKADGRGSACDELLRIAAGCVDVAPPVSAPAKVALPVVEEAQCGTCASFVDRVVVFCGEHGGRCERLGTTVYDGHAPADCPGHTPLPPAPSAPLSLAALASRLAVVEEAKGDVERRLARLERAANRADWELR